MTMTCHGSHRTASSLSDSDTDRVSSDGHDDRDRRAVSLPVSAASSLPVRGSVLAAARASMNTSAARVSQNDGNIYSSTDHSSGSECDDHDDDDGDEAHDDDATTVPSESDLVMKPRKCVSCKMCFFATQNTDLNRSFCSGECQFSAEFKLKDCQDAAFLVSSRFGPRSSVR